MKFLAMILSAIGATTANMGTHGGIYWVLDEPEMPKSLLEK